MQAKEVFQLLAAILLSLKSLCIVVLARSRSEVFNERCTVLFGGRNNLVASSARQSLRRLKNPINTNISTALKNNEEGHVFAESNFLVVKAWTRNAEHLVYSCTVVRSSRHTEDEVGTLVIEFLAISIAYVAFLQTLGTVTIA